MDAAANIRVNILPNKETDYVKFLALNKSFQETLPKEDVEVSMLMNNEWTLTLNLSMSSLPSFSAWRLQST